MLSSAACHSQLTAAYALYSGFLSLPNAHFCVSLLGSESCQRTATVNGLRKWDLHSRYSNKQPRRWTGWGLGWSGEGMRVVGGGEGHTSSLSVANSQFLHLLLNSDIKLFYLSIDLDWKYGPESVKPAGPLRVYLLRLAVEYHFLSKSCLKC